MAVLPHLSLAQASHSAEAQLAREGAERAVAEQRWCDAVHEFLKAYELSSPTVREALFNAALAAQRGSDRELAAALYERFVDSHPVHSHRAVAERRAQELREEIQRLGPGTPCPQSTLFTKDVPGQLVVRSNVVGAEVYVDGVLVGTTPLVFRPTTFEELSLQVGAPDHLPFIARVAPTLQRIVVDAHLQLSEAAREGRRDAGVTDRPGPFDVHRPEEEFPSSRRYGRLGRTGWMLMATGGAVMGGGGGFLWSSGQAGMELGLDLPQQGDLPRRVFDSDLQRLEDRYYSHRDFGIGGVAGGGALAGLGLLLVLVDGGEQ